MNPKKAIEILELNLKEAGNKMPPDCKAAIKLCIEATERLLWLRAQLRTLSLTHLPGETED